MGSQNYGKQAQYEAEMAAWEARNAYSSAMSATAASLGGLPGGLEPGNLPQESTGMAMSGEMSAGANSAARWADPYNTSSGFKSELGSRAHDLRSDHSTLGNYYQPSSVGLFTTQGGANIIGNYGYAGSFKERSIPSGEDESLITAKEAPRVDEEAMAEANKALGGN
jgi:hypothetical protein